MPIKSIVLFTLLAVLLLSITVSAETQANAETKPVQEEITVTDIKTGKEQNVNAPQETKPKQDVQDDTHRTLRKWLHKTYDDPWRTATRASRWMRSFLNDLFSDDEDDVFGLQNLWPSLENRRHSTPSLLRNLFEDSVLKLPTVGDVDSFWKSFKREGEWKETSEAFVGKISVPKDMKKEDLKIEVTKKEDGTNILTIRGKKEVHERSAAETPKESKESQPAAQNTASKDVAQAPESKVPSTHIEKPYKQFDQVEQFERSYVVPDTVDKTKITAHMEGSILEIILPKKPEAVKKPEVTNVNIM